jgi:hypothetical protein
MVDRFHGCFEGGMASEQDTYRVGITLSHQRKEFVTLHPDHAFIGYHHLEAVGLHELQSLFAAGCGMNLIWFIVQVLSQHSLNEGIVID